MGNNTSHNVQEKPDLKPADFIEDESANEESYHKQKLQLQESRIVSPEYIYIIQTRECSRIKQDNDVFKIGRTKQIEARFQSYAKESVVKFLIQVDDCILREKELLYIFDEKYERAKLPSGDYYGREYYRGDIAEMIHTIISHIIPLPLVALPVMIDAYEVCLKCIKDIGTQPDWYAEKIAKAELYSIFDNLIEALCCPADAYMNTEKLGNRGKKKFTQYMKNRLIIPTPKLKITTPEGECPAFALVPYNDIYI